MKRMKRMKRRVLSQEYTERNETLDVFCQTENKMKYRMILLKENTTYEIVASKYGVDIQLLKMLNKNKKLDCGMLMILPDK